MSLTAESTQPVEIFISYSHKDQDWRDALETHLSLLQHEGLVEGWHDRKIGAGQEWASEIDAHLNSARIILLLVSSDFIASRYCNEIEIPRAMERYAAGEASVVPVILRPADWNSAPFGKLQALPRDGKPITTWPDRDEAFLDVVRSIRKMVAEMGIKGGTATAQDAPATQRGMIGFPPPTDPRTIQQRSQVVEEVYAKLTAPQISALVLTGIGGAGKSTLAALIYRYAEEERRAGRGIFQDEAAWLTVHESATLVDVAGAILEVLHKPLPEFANLPLQNQAAALCNALNSAGAPRLIILDQFENLLDWRSGQARADKPGVGEWIDVLNSQPTLCRVLLTSRPWPQGTRDYPPTCMQEYAVQGLDTREGAALLRQQGVEVGQGTDAELRKAVARCAGHALSLTLLASMLRRNRSLTLFLLFNDPIYAPLWTDDMARSLLDYIYTAQLSEVQRRLLLAFSIYREPVALDAAQALVLDVPKAQMLPSLSVLLSQHLLHAVGDGRYQLHAIVTGYAQKHFDERDEQANAEALRAAHAKAAQYYLQRAGNLCPIREKRRAIRDVQPLIEAIWHYCQAEEWQEAYNLMEEESIFIDVRRWGGNVILLDLYALLLPDKWQPEPAQLADIYDCLGRLYDTLGKKSDALTCYEKALSIQREVGDRRGEGVTFNNLGGVYNDLGKREEALAYYAQALSIRREVGDRRGEGTTLNNLGAVYRALGKREEALAYYEQALSIRREVGDRRGEGATLNNLGAVYRVLDKPQEALAYYEQALSIWREVGDRAGEGTTLSNLGAVYADLGKKEEALAYFEQALSIGREVGDRDGEGVTLWNIGACYFGQARNEAALACFLLARGIFEEVQSPKVDGVQAWIENLSKKVGKRKFAALLAEVEPRAAQIVEGALEGGL